MSVATTAASPRIEDDRLIHVPDDIDRACRERTSLHLGERRENHRRFVHGTLGPFLMGGDRAVGRARSARWLSARLAWGGLDRAVASLMMQAAQREDIGTSIPAFTLVEEP